MAPSALPPPAAASSAAAPPPAPVVAGRTGRCEVGDESAADDGEPGGFGFSIEVQEGKITKAHYWVASGMGSQIGALAGPSGQAVREGEWIELPIEVEGPNGGVGEVVKMTRAMRLRVDGTTFAFSDEGAAPINGTCRWDGATAAPAARVVPIAIQRDLSGVTLTADGTMTSCSIARTLQAALASCEVRGRASHVYLGFGATDDEGKVMCGRVLGGYSFQHGGGWSDATFVDVGAAGASVRLSADVTIWFDSSLSQIVMSAPGSAVRMTLDAANDVLEAAEIAPGPLASAPLVLDLTQPAPKNAHGCQ
jgi:hypothetical protein